ncbi:MAG: nitrous oxide reductase family maturation protein NosD [Gammaproteobacteria bacterium]|nr:nitrous oxide reductase family maturation protein NosD [Gammaproteobacteria bacterium]
MISGQMIRWITGLLLLVSSSVSVADTPAVKQSLLQMIEAAKKGDVILLEPGVYKGPVTIEKAIILDGQGKATIDAGGEGSVIYLDTDGATIRNLRLTNSGNSHNDLDSGVQVRGNFNVIKDNVIDNCLFGIDLQQSEFNVVRRNDISSKPVDLGMRGDGIRLWYSFGNKITDNFIHDSRDMVVWYSKDNLIAKNRGTRGRYALHFMYAQHNKVEDNEYWDNSVGIFLMYSDGVELRRNKISHATGTTGVGIGMKESSEMVLEGNKVLYNAIGFYMDVSPFQPDTINLIKDNLVAFNNIGVRFLNDWPGNHFINNRFKSNITQVAVSDGKGANSNKWNGNYWDDYEGFDLDKNGVGDTPHEFYSYADRIWMDVPAAQFFKGSPMLEVLDFLERLAPFSPPQMVFRDSRPKIYVD